MTKTKYNNEDNNDQEFLSKIKKLIPDEEQRTIFIATLLGISGVLAEFIMDNNIIKNLPEMVRYACAMTAHNMIVFISDGEKATFKDMTKEPYKMGEQTQERIYRQMKWIVEELHKSLQEDEQT